MQTWHDPIHGQVSVDFAVGSDDIETILQSRSMTRLRRVKQLGFASFVYPMADHSRFTHALGTFHVAKQLARKVLAHQAITRTESAALKMSFPKLGKGDLKEGLLLHVAGAALIQDIGELPFEIALGAIYRPSESLRQELADWEAVTGTAPADKTVFTLSALRKIDTDNDLPLLDGELLGVLIADSESTYLTPVLRTLRNVLNSSLDADRIDYVYRDALLTIGEIGNPGQVIESIKTYHPDHVEISNPAHAGALLMTRNYLYRSVYLSPRKRLLERALRTVATAVMNEQRLKSRWQPTPLPGDIDLDEFLRLDDAEIMSAVGRLSGHGGEQLRRSVNTLLDEPTTRYESIWVAPPKNVSGVTPTELPVGVLADQWDDYARVGTVDPEFFQIDPSSFVGGNADQDISAWIPEIVGSSDIGVPSTLLAFVPSDLDSARRKRLEDGKASGALYYALRRQAMEQELEVPGDTSSRPTFTGPTIHISWCWDDVAVVRRVVRALFELKVRYKLLIDPFDGVGASTAANSAQLIKKAPSLLIVASRGFVERLSSQPNGNLATEMLACHERVLDKTMPPTIVVAANEVGEVRKRFPWAQIGQSDDTYLGTPLGNSSNDELSSAVEQVVASLRSGPS